MISLDVTKIIPIGTSSGIRLKKEALWHLGVTKDDPILLSMEEGGTIVIRKMTEDDEILTETEDNNEEIQ